MTIFGLKVMVKSGLEKNDFEIPRAPSESLLPSAEKSTQKGLNWPGWLAGISEGARGISK